MPKEKSQHSSKPDRPYRLLTSSSEYRRSESSLSNSNVYRNQNLETIEESIEELTSNFNLNLNLNSPSSSTICENSNFNIQTSSLNSPKLNMSTNPVYTVNPFKCIEQLPSYNGQIGTLNNFIAQVEIYYQLIPATDVLGRNVMNGLIRNKIIGEASNSLVGIGNPLEWSTIKAHLINYYSDKRSIDHLKRKLTELVQRHKTLEEYYLEASDLQTALINAVDPALTPAEKGYYIKDISKEVLREFLLGLKPELSTYVRPQIPADIKDAFETAKNQENYIRGQQAKLGLRSATDFRQNFSHSKPMFPQQTKPSFSQTRPTFPQQTKPIPAQQPSFQKWYPTTPNTYNRSPQQWQPSRPNFNPPRFNPVNPFTQPRQPNFRPPQFGQYGLMPPRQNQFPSQPNQFNSQLKPALPPPTPMDISVQSRMSRELHAQEPAQECDYQDYLEYYDQFYEESQPPEDPEPEYLELADKPEEFYQDPSPEIDDRNFQSSSLPPKKS